MTKELTTFEDLMKLGEDFGVVNCSDFRQAAIAYADEAALIRKMREQIENDDTTVTKEYVKGRQNLCIHPLIKEIPRHMDSANKCLALIADIIYKRGKKVVKEVDGLDEFR